MLTSALFAHRLGIGDGGAKESIPFESPVQPGPIVVAVAGVRQAPGNKCIELSVGGITLVASATVTYATR